MASNYTTSTPLDAALAYLDLGLALYAPAAGSKLPALGSSGQAGLTSAMPTTDSARVREIYAADPARNVAARLDACTPQLVVLDLDTQAAHPHTPADPDGADALRSWATENAVSLPQTWAVRTASGGTHLLYRLPDGETLPKSTDNLLPHVDALGAGHGEILPPSRIAGDPLRTQPYTWADGHSPADLPLAELPRPLLDLWRASKVDGRATASGRNSALTSLCGGWRAQGCDAAELERRALAWNTRQPDPLPESEVRKTAASVARYPQGRGRAQRATQGALVEFMRGDSELCGQFGINALTGGLYVTGALPWSQLYEGPRRWTDADAENLFVYLQDHANAGARDTVNGALTIVAAEQRFNPLSEFLASELPEWDGYGRADLWLHDLLGAQRTDYMAAAGHTWLRGAVLRAMRPGCKFDLVLVLVGPQGCGKSLTLRRLAVRPDLFTEGVTDLSRPQEVAEQTAGKWLVELPELEGMVGRRATAIKLELTRQVTTVRLPYARHATDLPRSCVFASTTNEGRFLSDPTGARRFLPVRVAVEQPRLIETTRDERLARAYCLQLWAEVMREYRDACKLPEDQFAQAFPTTLDRDTERQAEAVRAEFTVEDTDAAAVGEWLRSAVARGTTRVCTRQVAINALGVPDGAMRRSITNHVADILDRADGWRRCDGKQRVEGYGTVTAWEWDGHLLP